MTRATSLSEPTEPLPGHPVTRFNRRYFLLGTAAISGIGAGFRLPRAALAANEAGTGGIHAIAQFLTGKVLEPGLAERAGSALAKVDPSFPNALSALADFIDQHDIEDLEALKAAPDFEGDLKKTAQKLLSALYCGYAGEPKAHSSEDNVEFVTYTRALTWRLTYDKTPIPSYSRWGTGYWHHLPDPS